MNVEVYNMTQAQRDAAHIAALEKQVADLSEVIKKIVCNKSYVSVNLSLMDVEASADVKGLMEALRANATEQLGYFILDKLGERRGLYQRLAQYEQWFYTQTNYTTRHDALRSTMTTAR